MSELSSEKSLFAGKRESVAVFGATGSIGKSTLDILARHPERFSCFALSGHAQIEALLALCIKFKPKYVVLSDVAKEAEFAAMLAEQKLETQLLLGQEGLAFVAEHEALDTLVAAIVGAAGLPSSLAAAKAGKKILLANKESLVMAGQLFMDAVKASGARLLPIDSEHNAIFQCLPPKQLPKLAITPDGEGEREVCKILLTASGGPFRQKPLDEFTDITVAEAVAHPNWSMGRKISVDSASMMNKGLELIEACWLFGIEPSDIDVVVHPQSIIHSMVQYVDGTTLAQMGNPDMRTPIANALAWPDRIDAGVAPLDMFAVAKLDFEPADTKRFPNLSLAAKAFDLGGAMPAVLNAANEVAVEAFLQEQIRFIDIPVLNQQTMQRLEACAQVQCTTIDALLDIDARARETAQAIIQEINA